MSAFDLISVVRHARLVICEPNAQLTHLVICKDVCLRKKRDTKDGCFAFGDRANGDEVPRNCHLKAITQENGYWKGGGAKSCGEGGGKSQSRFIGFDAGSQVGGGSAVRYRPRCGREGDAGEVNFPWTGTRETPPPNLVGWTSEGSFESFGRVAAEDQRAVCVRVGRRIIELWDAVVETNGSGGNVASFIEAVEKGGIETESKLLISNVVHKAHAG